MNRDDVSLSKKIVSCRVVFARDTLRQLHNLRWLYSSKLNVSFYIAKRKKEKGYEPQSIILFPPNRFISQPEQQR